MYKKILIRATIYLVIILTAFFIIYPLIYTLFTSLKTKEDYLLNPININIANLTLENYKNILCNFDIGQKVFNTSLVVITSLIIIFILAIPSAYYICGIKRKALKRIIILFCFMFMFIPEEVLILPEYNMMAKMGLINHFLSVIIIFVAASLPEVIFLLYVYYRLIPSEIIEAAKIDGASGLECLICIIVPISKSPIIVVSITTLISLWNTFLVPMLLLFDDSHKLLVPSLAGLITKYSTSPTYQMAGVFISMLPLIIVYFIFKKQIFKNSIGGAIR